MADRSINQPSDVSTEDRPRPPDESVVTSDVDLSAGVAPNKPAEPSRDSKHSAAASDKDRPNGQASATDDSQSDQPPKRRNQPAEYRIKKLTRKLADSEREREQLSRRLAEQDQRLAALEQRAQGDDSDNDPPPEPQLDDFKNPREYAKAYAKWEREVAKPSKASPSRSTPRQTRNDPPASPPPPPADAEITKWQRAGTEKYGDEFQEALQAQIAVNRDMADFILDSEHGHALYIHLANNPDEATSIYNMSARRAEKALAELEAKATQGGLDVPDDGELQVDDKTGDDNTPPAKTGTSAKGKTTGDDDTPPARGRQRTRAPEPPNNQNKDRSTPVTDVDLEQLDMDDYAAVRRQQLKDQRF